MKTTPSGGFECDAELIGGPEDGFKYTMIRRKKPAIGLRRAQDGHFYRLLEFRNGVAIFKYGGRIQ